MSEAPIRMSEKARNVRAMFGAIARRYDFLNHFLSGNIDRRWRRVCVDEVSRRCAGSRPRILDIGCGTGDLSLAFSHLGPVVGCDFCRPMLSLGKQKTARAGGGADIFFLEADALALPFPDGSFEVVVSAFVLRNIADMDSGLSEMRRVLRPGGVVGILDFGMPKPPFIGKLYRFYFLRILPRIGEFFSGVKGAYKYLPDSVQAFPGADELRRRLAQAGFIKAEARLLAGGIAVLLVASVP